MAKEGNNKEGRKDENNYCMQFITHTSCCILHLELIEYPSGLTVRRWVSHYPVAQTKLEGLGSKPHPEPLTKTFDVLGTRAV